MIDASISISGRIQAVVAIAIAIQVLGGFGGIIFAIGIMARASGERVPANQGL